MHAIRLRGPWEYEPVPGTVLSADESSPDASAEPPPPGRVRLPDQANPLASSGFRGRVRYRRRFGQPTNLDPGQKVWLVFDGVRPAAAATLNGHSLQSSAGLLRFDVTDRLRFRNELTLEVEWQDGPPGDVRLEIEE